MKKKEANFQVVDILPIALTFVVAGIGIAYGINVLGETKRDFIKGNANYGAGGCTGSDGSNCTGTDSVTINATEDTIIGVGKVPEKMPLVINVVIAAIIIGVLIRYLMVKYM